MLLSKVTLVFEMKYINLSELEASDDPVVKHVVRACEAKGLKEIMRFRYDWSTEILL